MAAVAQVPQAEAEQFVAVEETDLGECRSLVPEHVFVTVQPVSITGVIDFSDAAER